MNNLSEISQDLDNIYDMVHNMRYRVDEVIRELYEALDLDEKELEDLYSQRLRISRIAYIYRLLKERKDAEFSRIENVRERFELRRAFRKTWKRETEMLRDLIQWGLLLYTFTAPVLDKEQLLRDRWPISKEAEEEVRVKLSSKF